MDAGHGLWLLPTEAFQRRALAARGSVESAQFASDQDAARALDNRIRRNGLLDARIRSEAERLGLAVVEVDGSQDLPAMTELVHRHFRRAITTMPGTRTGEHRQRLRRSENDAMVSNVRAFLTELRRPAPAQWPLPFSCECERLGCDVVTWHTPSDYDALRATAEPITAHRDHTGPM